MKLKPEQVQLLEEHLDLLSTPKRELARWLCENWDNQEAKIPNKLWQIANKSFPFHSQIDSTESLIKRLILDLLSTNKTEIANRKRIGASRHKPAKPMIVK